MCGNERSSIHEGDELGCPLRHSFGAVFDTPSRSSPVVGDGQASTQERKLPEQNFFAPVAQLHPVFSQSWFHSVSLSRTQPGQEISRLLFFGASNSHNFPGNLFG